MNMKIIQKSYQIIHIPTEAFHLKGDSAVGLTIPYDSLFSRREYNSEILGSAFTVL